MGPQQRANKPGPAGARLVLKLLLVGACCASLSGNQPPLLLAQQLSATDNSPRPVVSQVIEFRDPQATNGAHSRVTKCSRQSINLARQVLVHEFESINGFNSIWFNDLDQVELLESQKQSLSNIVMSGAGTRLLNSDGHALLEIEASYFRPIEPLAAQLKHFAALDPSQSRTFHARQASPYSAVNLLPINIKLLRRHQDRCYLQHSDNGAHYIYSLGLSVGPFEHNLDVVYNLPRDLSLGQPISWRYAQISLLVQRMIYEVTLKQAAGYQLGSAACPLELNDVTFVSLPKNSNKTPSVSIVTNGLALNNQTASQLDRLFDDYTRPAISSRLRQILKFYLNTRSLPLAV